jgi:Protein of unknown function (DUF3040)
VPLSEHEQRLLEQMERALYAEDPKFASSMRGADARRHHRRRILLAVAGFVAGVVVLFTGLVQQIILLGVAGFVVVLASIWYAVLSWQRMSKPASPPAAGNPGGATPLAARRKPKASRGRFMERIEERWRRRREERGDF